MEYKTTITNKQGRVIDVAIFPIESELDFKDKKIKDARAYCFYKDQMVLVWAKDHWNTPGGALEEGENARDAVRREVKEETNMNVIRQRFVCLQTYSFQEPVLENEKGQSYQTVSICLVEPYGEFISDPDGDVDKIKLIDPKDYKQYLDWGERGDKLMERVLDVKRQMDTEVNYVS